MCASHFLDKMVLNKKVERNGFHNVAGNVCETPVPRKLFAEVLWW